MEKMINQVSKITGHASSVISSRITTMAERAIYPVLQESAEREELEKLDIPTLYGMLDELVAEQSSLPQVIRDSVKGQITFLKEMCGALYDMRSKTLHHLEANRIDKEHEESFLDALKTAGLKVHYESEISPEEIAQKPCLILATHQGGGWENYLAQAMTGIECGIVIKDELMRYPFIKNGLERKKAIAVQRAMLNNPESRRIEIDRIAREIASRLAANENMLVFFEGTRSRDGQIASTPLRKAWARDLLAAIDHAWAAKKANGMSSGRSIPAAGSAPNREHKPPKDFQKLLLVVHTKTAMPDVPEEDFLLTRFRLNTTLSAKLVKADNLKTEESSDLYDPDTLFGKARSILKEMLIQIILEHQNA